MTNLRTKKELAAKALKVGKNRIVFNTEGLSEIKEAITKQDIKDLVREGIISIRLVKGRKKVKRRKTKRGPGKIKKKVKRRKQEYVKITRKLRKYLMELKDKGVVDKELYWDLRKKIKMRNFKSKANFRDYLKDSKIEIDTEQKQTASFRMQSVSNETGFSSVSPLKKNSVFLRHENSKSKKKFSLKPRQTHDFSRGYKTEGFGDDMHKNKERFEKARKDEQANQKKNPKNEKPDINRKLKTKKDKKEK